MQGTCHFDANLTIMQQADAKYIIMLRTYHFEGLLTSGQQVYEGITIMQEVDEYIYIIMPTHHFEGK
jgi:hypothetical protein